MSSVVAMYARSASEGEARPHRARSFGLAGRLSALTFDPLSAATNVATTASQMNAWTGTK